jgi:Zn-dependent alcohol dehydrogenase
VLLTVLAVLVIGLGGIGLSAVMGARLAGAGIAPRVTLGAGWLLLPGAVAASFIAQSRVAAAMDALANGDDRQGIRSSGWSALALASMLGGLVLTGFAALMM